MTVECDATDCKYCSDDCECTREHLCVDVDCICGCWEEKISGKDGEQE